MWGPDPTGLGSSEEEEKETTGKHREEPGSGLGQRAAKDSVLPRNQPRSRLDLGLPASRTVKTSFLWFRPPV